MNNLDKNKPVTTRRRFLKRAWAALGIIAGVEMGIISLGFLFTGKKSGKNTNGNNLLVVGNISDFDNNAVYPFRNGRFYLVRLKDGGFLALSLKCTHLGCSVMWDEKETRFNCPCHASSFDIYGNVIDPPAPRALDMFPVLIEKGQVLVDVANPGKRQGFDKKQIVYA